MPKRVDLLDRLNLFVHGREELPEEICHFCVADGRAFLERIKSYYALNDLETGFVHAEIFTALYLVEKCKSLDEIAIEFNVHSYSLDRYRQRYNKFARRLLKK